MIIALIAPVLLGFLINIFRFKSQNLLSGWVGSGACLLSFLATCWSFFTFSGEPLVFSLFSWIELGGLNLTFSFVLDSLSLLMALLITGVGFVIHVYSIGYMSHDKGISRYFAYLNLFVFMMLVLVLADSLPLLFIGWEGVGLCSYLLIGFWFDEAKNTQAGTKAFLVNRVGDACFLLGMFLIFSQFGSLVFSELNPMFSGKQFLGFSSLETLGALFLFLGATGKSAQFPLHIWLADAMAGPTPVSALIHAATMVTAGVYMIVRLFAMYAASPDLLTLIGWIGALTALGAALIAGTQWDLKKILAYSTVSQLAYMFMAISAKAFTASIFHLLTHGFFKALLFLCAGSLIHGLSGEQDIRRMGGLKKYFPKTFWTYMVGALCLVALPPFSGFFSKDEILASLFSHQKYGLWLVALLASFCTAFYVTRMTYFVFFNKENFKTKPHESPLILLAPLFVLAFFALSSGFLGIPHAFSAWLPLHPPHFLSQFLHAFSPQALNLSLGQEWMLIGVTVGGALGVIALTQMFHKRSKAQLPTFFDKGKLILENSFYLDAGLKKFVYPAFESIAQVLFQAVDVDFFQKGLFVLGQKVLDVRKFLVRLQDGNLQSYAFYFVMGLSVFLVLIFLR